jgi:hypothetical protein
LEKLSTVIDDITKLVATIGNIPNKIGKNHVGGVLFTIMFCYALYLGAPILKGWLGIKETVKVERVERGPQGSGVYRIKTSPVE